MHFLSAKTGFTETEAQGVDLDQSPADIIFLSTADGITCRHTSGLIRRINTYLHQR